MACTRPNLTTGSALLDLDRTVPAPGRLGNHSKQGYCSGSLPVSAMRRG